jgi:hypothetical protein
MIDGSKPSSTADDSPMLVAQVLEGLEDADAERTIATEELLQQVDLWCR